MPYNCSVNLCLEANVTYKVSFRTCNFLPSTLNMLICFIEKKPRQDVFVKHQCPYQGQDHIDKIMLGCTERSFTNDAHLKYESGV